MTRIPPVLEAALAGHDVSSVQAQGWSGTKNGTLLQHAGEFSDVWLSMDQCLLHEQNLSDLSLCTLIIRAPSNHMVHLQPLVDSILQTLAAASPGQLREIRPARPSTRTPYANGPTLLE